MTCCRSRPSSAFCSTLPAVGAAPHSGWRISRSGFAACNGDSRDRLRPADALAIVREYALDLAILNQIDRFSLASDVIDRVPRFRVAGAHAKEKLRNAQINCQNYAYEHGVDKLEIDQ